MAPHHPPPMPDETQPGAEPGVEVLHLAEDRITFMLSNVDC